MARQTQDFSRGRFRSDIDAVPIITFDPNVFDASLAGEIKPVLKLTGVSSLLNIGISAGFVPTEGKDLIGPLQLPANPGTLTVTGLNDLDGSSRMLLEPLSPFPKTLPATYSIGAGFNIPGAVAQGGSVVDCYMIQPFVDLANYFNTHFEGRLIVSVIAEYNGSWWDVATIKALLADVRLTSVGPITAGTGGAPP